MIDQQEMMRQIHRYAMEEMRNRGIEEAAQAIERRALRFRGSDRYDANIYAREVRALKRNPADQMTDWWGTEEQPAAVSCRE